MENITQTQRTTYAGTKLKKGRVETRQDQKTVSDLGEYYMGHMQETIEEWYSKPRDGHHVTDVMCQSRWKYYK
jgi:hypothetical protein